jgi:magnesium transporter
LQTDNRTVIDLYRWDESGRCTLEGGPASLSVAEGEWVWVDVVGASHEEIRSIAEQLGLDEASIEESFAPAGLPVVEEHVDQIYLVLHGFSTGSGERLSASEIDLFIGKTFLVTIRDGPRDTIELLKERLSEDDGVPVSSPAGLLAFMALGAVRAYGPLILELERQVDNLEEMAIRGDPQTAVEVHALRRDVIFLRRALGPQFDVYEDLSESGHPAIDDDARHLFVRVAGQHRRALEALESGRALLGSVLETYRGAVADQTNEIMRVLTVFSAILLPLTLIAGLWGMNFADVPGADIRWGFWGVIAAMAVLVIGVWVYFTRRGFIGAPRLRDLPKAVGLGLFTIGTAPIRVVAGGIRHLGKSEE